jgi:uncharacterized coiled-coil DUF342 family protein
MTPKSNELKDLLTQTETRLRELRAMETEFTGEVQTLQDGFTHGKKSFTQLQAGQSKLSTLRDSIHALELKQTELQTAFDEQTAAETLQNTIEAAIVTAHEANKLFKESLVIREEINNLLADYAEKFQNKFGAFHEKKKQYRNLTAQFDGKLNIPADVRNLVESRAGDENFPRLPYAPAFGAALDVLTHEKRRQEYAELAKNRAA